MTEIEDNDHDREIWDIGVFDAHCHPTDILTSIESIATMNARVLTLMSTRAQDQNLVAEAASRYQLATDADIKTGCYIIPAFGWHPWFSYQLYDDRVHEVGISASDHYKRVLTPSPDDESFINSLPRPRSLSSFLRETEERLLKFPIALVGEVGLDRAFRLPIASSDPSNHDHEDGEYTPGSREGRPLSPHRVVLDHQKTVLKAQLQLAAKHRRAVSIHSVQTHGVVFEVLQELWKGHEKLSKSKQKRQKHDFHPLNAENEEESDHIKPIPYPPRICMHSYSGPVDPLKQFLAQSVPAEIYFSFSEVINFSNASASKVTEVIKALPDDRILIESDLHCAGERMDDLLIRILNRVCEIKGWDRVAGAEQLRKNWERFIFSKTIP